MISVIMKYGSDRQVSCPLKFSDMAWWMKVPAESAESADSAIQCPIYVLCVPAVHVGVTIVQSM
jgi:hypothetical protein